MKYPTAKNGERIAPVMRGYKMTCCDCGLAHSLDFSVVEKVKDNRDGTWASRKPKNAAKLRVILVPNRDNRITGQLRRHRDYPMKPTK